MKLTESRVWIVKYNHDYGDLYEWVCDSSETAEAKCLDVVKEWRSEYEIPKVYTDQYCLDHWDELTGYSGDTLCYRDEPLLSKGDLN